MQTDKRNDRGRRAAATGVLLTALVSAIAVVPLAIADIDGSSPPQSGTGTTGHSSSEGPQSTGFDDVQSIESPDEGSFGNQQYADPVGGSLARDRVGHLERISRNGAVLVRWVVGPGAVR